MFLQKIRTFLKSYLLIRILLNAVFLSVWIRGTIDNFNHSGIKGNDRELLLIHTIAYNTLLLATLYINTLVFIPKLLLRKKYFLYIVCLLTGIILHTVLLVFYREYILNTIPGIKTYDFSYYSAFTRSSGERTLQFFFYIFYSTSCFTILQFSLVFLGQHFFIAIRQNELIRQQQTEIELSVLKSQINPHFLFNVLNNIYSLSLKKSEQTPEVVMRLSEILRYMLYEAKHELVPLKKEIQMICDYADIEQMRLSKEQELKMNFEEDQIPPLRIAPLLLIPFVENAIKHGTNSIASGAYVFIDMKVTGTTLYFSCKNNYKPMPASKNSGLGLENVGKRLQLLYPGKHVLDIKRQNNTFEVLLSIQLSL
ncbi:MAG TPA: histidine kinase [Chitinophagaceae bacterium]|nr:histidine kinase [Chitinophagaceae bacterium]